MASLLPLHVFLSILLLLLFCRLRLIRNESLNKVPGPLLARFSGLYRLFLVYKGKGPDEYFKLHQKYGSIVRVGPSHVSVSDVSMIPIIYGIGSKFTKTAFYTTMEPVYQGEAMASLFTTRDPQYHKILKRPVAQLYSMTNIRNYEAHTDECTAIFIKLMQELQERPVDLATWLQWYAFDVIGNITFQRRFGFMEKQQDVDGMIYNIHRGLNYVKFVGQFPALHGWLFRTRLGKAAATRILPVGDPLTKFMEITDNEITRYDQKGQKTGRTDFLAQLRQNQARDGKMSHRDMMNHLSNNLLAGSDTTAISLRACLYYLIKNREAYQKLVAEIRNAERNGKLSAYVTYQEALELPYLQAVIKEAMRIHPGVGLPLERHVPSEGTIICGYHLPAGTNISMSAPTIHQDKEIFGEDADQFRPERWLESSPENLKNMDRAFLSFGFGARTCIGKNISIMEMGKFIPQIMRKFHIEWASSSPNWQTNCAWFWMQSDMIVKFTEREIV